MIGASKIFDFWTGKNQGFLDRRLNKDVSTNTKSNVARVTRGGGGLQGEKGLRKSVGQLLQR